MMCSYHRLWLSIVGLSILTTSMCGFASEIEVSENTPHMQHDDAHPHLDTQASATASLKPDAIVRGAAEDDLWNSLRFDPTFVDFGIGTVGTVRSHVVTLHNENRNHSVHLSSVTGRTPAFYSSFFESKMIPPNGNTTFNVVFLPRDQGAVSTTLIIQTSFGKLKLQLRGEGRECPYRLKPLVGIKAPLNATLMPEIHMHNPHGRPLQILEVYSSGGQFQLELPSGDPEAPKGLWEIPPFSTKPVIRIRFQGFAAGNYSAFIRIKIAEPYGSDDENYPSGSSDGTEEQVLVIPVEFEILPEYGLYAVNPLLEFGYLTINDTTKPFKQKIDLRHSKTHMRQLENFKFDSITYIKGVTMAEDDMISTVSIDPADVYEPVTELNEKIQLILKDTSAAYAYHSVELIIRANIFKGILHCNSANSTIFIDHKEMESSPASDSSEADALETVVYTEKSKTLQLRNDFHIPLAIYNVTTTPQINNNSSKVTLQLKSFKENKGFVLQPALTWELLVAVRIYKHRQDLEDPSGYYKTVIYVYTNVTYFEIPIVISTARLFVTTQTQKLWRSNYSVYTKELQLSSVPLREASKNGYIILQNRNPIPIKLKSWEFDNSNHLYYAIKAQGCIRARYINESNDYIVDLNANYELKDELHEGDVAVFVLNVTPYLMDLNTALLKIKTKFENLTVAVKFNTVMGKLEVDQDKLHFADCFPGKLCTSELSIRSNFRHPVHIKNVNFTAPGLRFEDTTPHGLMIAPQTVTTIGRLYFEPSALCVGSCYISQQQAEANPTIPSSQINVPAFDEVELRRRIELYRHFKYFFQNVEFVVTTEDMKHFQLNLIIELQWPKLVRGRQVFTTTEVKKSQVYIMKISNPSEQPILIDYQLADPILAKQTLISLPLEVIMLTPSCYLTDKEVFSLVAKTPTKPILIPALSSIEVGIRFHSNAIGSFCTILHVRNNLTLYEGIWISARAVQSQFRLGNRKPGSQTPLLFEITEQQLSLACPARSAREDIESHTLRPQIVTRRVFTARNFGELPIEIEGFLIGDQPCKGYGFQIMNCSRFLLKANSSKTIEIVFHSDFTVTRMVKPLVLQTNLTYDVQYTLVAQLPSKGLQQCNALLSRPPWEDKIRNATVIMLMATFVLVIIAVHIDYGNIMYQSTLYGEREKGQIHPTFNLRNIAMGSSNTQNNNETYADVSHRNRNTLGGLKKRNVNNKHQKQSNGDVTLSSINSLSNTMTLAEMVSWTFGSKSTKKALKMPKVKDPTSTIDTNKNAPVAATYQVKASGAATKICEKSLIEKMDDELKKSQNFKKIKVAEKAVTKTEEKCCMQDLEYMERNAKSKAVTTTAAPVAEIQENYVRQPEQKDQKNPLGGEYLWKPLGQSQTMSKTLPMTEITNQQGTFAKDCTNGRKLGKTPGRERRKQSVQSTSPATSSCSSNSTSSSANQAKTATKRHERKSKTKASNSSKFASDTHIIAPYSAMPTDFYLNGRSESTFYSDALSPWVYGSQISCNSAMQQRIDVATSSQQTCSPMTTLHSSPTALLNTDLANHSASLADAMAAGSQPTIQIVSKDMEKFETDNAKPPPSDLGPIGSRKSPSSSPNWESHNSVNTMQQIGRVLNTSSTTTTASALPFIHSQGHNLYPQLQQQQQHQHFLHHPHVTQMTPNYGYNDMSSRVTQSSLPQLSPTEAQKQHDFDITAKLLEIQAHEELVRRYREQLILHQQRQQYFNYIQAINSDWSSQHSAASAWSPIMDNVSASNMLAAMCTNDPSSLSTWSMTHTSQAPVDVPTSSGFITNSTQLFDHNFPTEYVHTASSAVSSSAQNSKSDNFTGAVTSHSQATSTPSTFYNRNNNGSTDIMTVNGLNTNNDVPTDDNMPMFNLFGGLSSIWNDNWKQEQEQIKPPQEE